MHRFTLRSPRGQLPIASSALIRHLPNMVWIDNDRHSLIASPRLARALLLSIVAHLCVFSFIEIGRRQGWLDEMFSSVKQPPAPSEVPREITIEFEPPKRAAGPSLTFMEVMPTQATPEVPPDAKFYSALNSRASNPDTSVDSNVPQVSGTQDKVMKTTDTLRVPAKVEVPQPPLVPAKELEKTVKEPVKEELVSKQLEKPVEQPKPQNPPKIEEKGDMILAKRTEPLPEPKVQPRDETAPTSPKPAAKARPRRLASVMPPPDIQSAILGEKVHQTGGVRRFGIESTFDVRSTEFGAYDAAIIAAIQKRWYDLLEDRNVSRREIGKVILEFHLTVDGRITNMREQESEVAPTLGLVCQRAVQDPAPYAAWPPDLRRIVGKDYREVRFVFHYN
ncbi:MAG: hypothetical protein EXS31_17150 [Pedosphaera sp.]|nr:hypothetical protein [Pedosphaera sp.]